MYPEVKVKVKVRQEDQDDDHLSSSRNGESWLFSRVVDESLSCSPAKENNSSSSASVSGALKKAYYIPDLKGIISRSDTVKNKRPIRREDAKPDVAAKSVSRPRAVLSSPDNDGMIGIRNKILNERPLALNNENKTKQKTPAMAQTKFRAEPERAESSPFLLDARKSGEQSLDSAKRVRGGVKQSRAPSALAKRKVDLKQGISGSKIGTSKI